jgi:hypothetical protein
MRHARNHLEWEQTAFRTAADRRSMDVNDAGERLAGASAVFAAIRQRGLDLILDDELRPSVRDTIEATRALQAIEDERTDEMSHEGMLVQLDRIIQAIREEVPQGLWPAIAARIEAGEEADRDLEESDGIVDAVLAEQRAEELAERTEAQPR